MICTCERCGRALNLLRFYDSITDGTVFLCNGCFLWFANGRRKGGLPVPNARKVQHGENVSASTALAL